MLTNDRNGDTTMPPTQTQQGPRAQAPRASAESSSACWAAVGSGDLGEPGTLEVREVGSQDHVLERWQKTGQCVN